MTVVLVRNVGSYRKDAIVAERNFYGALRIKEFHDWLKEPYYTLYNGKIEHGARPIDSGELLRAEIQHGLARPDVARIQAHARARRIMRGEAAGRLWR